ncbi:MAG: helix-hairpin-helix domain-containing protein [Candidatus Deferrimicrobiaceae bacterium]
MKNRQIANVFNEIASLLEQFLETGRIDLHDDLKREIPAGVLDILRVPGIGPKTAKMLYEKAEVRWLDDLDALSREGGLAGLPGIQKKTEENILKGVDTLRRGLAAWIHERGDRPDPAHAAQLRRGRMRPLRGLIPRQEDRRSENGTKRRDHESGLVPGRRDARVSWRRRPGGNPLLGDLPRKEQRRSLPMREPAHRTRNLSAGYEPGRFPGKWSPRSIRIFAPSGTSTRLEIFGCSPKGNASVTSRAGTG